MSGINVSAPVYPTRSPFERCLDRGFVALIEHMGSDLSVARAARVKPEEAWRDPDPADPKAPHDAKLIAFMRRNRHNTPFEKVCFTFWVKAPIFVYRQWHRHRTWSFNEQSARYMAMDGEFYIPDPALVGEQSTGNHQGRTLDPALVVRRLAEVSLVEASCARAYAGYQDLLQAGWPRELARTVLPVSLYSQMEATVDLHNLLGFLTLRADPHAQHEIRVYAEAMLRLIRPIVPHCVAAWESAR